MEKQRSEFSYLIEMISELFCIPVMLWNKENMLQSSGEEAPFLNPEKNRRLLSCVEGVIGQEESPCLFFETEAVFYGIIPLDSKIRMLTGPFIQNSMPHSAEEDFIAEHGISPEQALLKRNIWRTARLLCFIFYIIHKKQLDYRQVQLFTKEGNMLNWQVEHSVESYQLSQSDNERSHAFGRDMENKLMEVVRRGDLEGAQKLLDEEMPDVDETGVFANTATKAEEYMLVSMITLITRAAVDGGLNAERAYEIGDVYLQQISHCVSRGENIGLIGYRAMNDMTKAVSDAKSARSSHSFIEDCKGFVESNLRKNVTIAEIGPAIGISRTYLARRFRETEGITLQEYIIRRKCEHAANMLRFSDYPISLISEYFCFSSPGYFAKCFKEIHGISPKEYRSKFHVSDK